MATHDHSTQPGSGEPVAEQAGDTMSTPGRRPDATRRTYSYDVTKSRATRRREKIAAEIARNRRGEYTVPTWVLALVLALILGTWVALIAFG